MVASHFAIGPVRTGGGGVTLFFVLSGYLITRLLLEERDRLGGVPLIAFYGRRARRLLPVLIAVLPVYAVVAARSGTEWGLGLLSSLTYTANYVAVDHDLGPFGATWSLAIEEHFYLFWPLILVVARQRVLAVAAAGAVVAVALRTLLVLDGASYVEVYHWTHTRADALLVGCVLGVLAHEGRRWRPNRAAVGLAWASLALYATSLDLDELALWGITVSVVASAVLVAWGAETSNRILCAAPLRHLGRISYSLYLWHFAVWHTFGPGVASLALSVVLAELSHRVIEQRFRLRAPAPTMPPRADISP